MVARGWDDRGAMGVRAVCLSKGNRRDPRGDGTILCVDYVIFNILFMICI